MARIVLKAPSRPETQARCSAPPSEGGSMFQGHPDFSPCRRRVTAILLTALAAVLLASPGFAAARRTKAGGPGGIGFTSSTYEAQESVGPAPMMVQRLGGTDGAVTVDYAVTGGTAT